MKYQNWMTGLIFLGVLLSPVMASAMAGPPSAGEVSKMTGDVAEARQPDGTSRKLSVGDAVYSGEHISTDKNTSVHIQFTDESRFALGPNTEFVIDKFKYTKGAEEDAFHSRIIKGVFRFVSGLIAHTKGREMTVRARVATIGIRGTQVEGEVTDRQEIDGKTVDASAKIVLLEPEEAGKQTSIVVSNEFGSVVIDKPGYGTEIPDEKSPPSPVRKMQIRTIENVLRALRNSVRQSGTARPRMP
ncbi:MAG: FecR domain-containing protein [Gammaproteobacteria bacterium]|nr:FecR domain-containing protein [Gammaproteobacteria bacterium]MBU1480227.1 FecR domain-containing protein [Gammaproteobacteria bacterium]